MTWIFKIARPYYDPFHNYLQISFDGQRPKLTIVSKYMSRKPFPKFPPSPTHPRHQL